LQQQTVKEIRRIPEGKFGNIWFQQLQDCCRAHTAVLVQKQSNNTRTFLNFLLSGWGTILWPARSADLGPNDFFLWRCIKTKIYLFREDNASDLMELQLTT
jgi:hypothetical protein